MPPLHVNKILHYEVRFAGSQCKNFEYKLCGRDHEVDTAEGDDDTMRVITNHGYPCDDELCVGSMWSYKLHLNLNTVGIIIIVRDRHTKDMLRSSIKKVEISIKQKGRVYRHTISGGHLRAHQVSKSDAYNYPYDLKDCYYIPLHSLYICSSLEDVRLIITFKRCGEYRTEILHVYKNMFWMRNGMADLLYSIS
jgi:hypothetical protein